MADNLTTTVSSKSQTVEINRSNPTVIIGERINPTGRKKLQATLQEGNFEIVRSDAAAQVEAGAAILDVNAGVPGADEPELLVGARNGSPLVVGIGEGTYYLASDVAAISNTMPPANTLASACLLFIILLTSDL